jgi:hypothetical protein
MTRCSAAWSKRTTGARRWPQGKVFADAGPFRLSSSDMAKHSSNILELAKRGAQHRYEELKAELDSLVRHFPDLGAGAREVVKRGRRAVKAVAELAPKRRKMSAAARKAIGDAQRARWAKHKAAKQKAPEPETSTPPVRKVGKKR